MKIIEIAAIRWSMVLLSTLREQCRTLRKWLGE